VSCQFGSRGVVDGRDRQFFFEPEDEVLGFADVMRAPACLAMVIMKSWISRRLRSAIVRGVCMLRMGMR
jgi:hypothetical protein